jgi:hypothetical protein
MQTPFQSRPASTATRTISVKMSNGAGDEVAWLADGGHLCGYRDRAKFAAVDEAAEAAAQAEKRHNLYADCESRDD